MKSVTAENGAKTRGSKSKARSRSGTQSPMGSKARNGSKVHASTGFSRSQRSEGPPRCQSVVEHADRVQEREFLGPHAGGSDRPGRKDRRCAERRSGTQPENGQRIRAHQPGGRQGRQDHAARVHWIGHWGVGGLRRVGEQPDWRSGAAVDRSGARDRRGGQGRSVAEHVARSGRASAARRIPAHRARGQHDGGAVEFVRERSDARGARSGNRRQAGRPGGGAGASRERGRI